MPIGGRLLEGGARGVGRIAGATGIDRTVEVAVEEAIVRALESAAVERAIARLVEDGRIAEAIEESIDDERLEAAIRRGLDSEVADRVWEDVLASEKAQMLVERIAEAPEVRVALASQGVGLVADLGRQVVRAARRSTTSSSGSSAGSSVAAHGPRPTDHVGLAGRGVALAADAGILAGGLRAVHGDALRRRAADHRREDAAVGGGAALALPASSSSRSTSSASGRSRGRRRGCASSASSSTTTAARGSAPGAPSGRLWATILAGLPFGLGFVPILFRDDRRGLQDRIAATDVVRRDNRVLAPWSENHVPGRPG